MRIRTQLPFFRRAARSMGSRLFHWAENNGRPVIEINGEGWLLDALVRRWASEGATRRVVIDAGANRGDFTARLLEAAGRCSVAVEVHAVDPASSCIDALRQRFAGLPSVQIIRAALGESAGALRLHSPVSGSPHASLLVRAGAADLAGEETPVIRLDEYLRQQGFPQISFLKLDVEGYELAALRGLGTCLRPKTVAVIQFEYGGTTLDAGHALRDFFELLERSGYAVAKLMPRALEVRRYAPWMDHFAYANYVAVPITWRPDSL